jgi:hypothetical protein
VANKYEVQEYTLCDGWVNNWSHTQDGSNEPTQFISREGAQAELDWFLKDCLEEVKAGNMADAPSLEDFRIVEVQ